MTTLRTFVLAGSLLVAPSAFAQPVQAPAKETQDKEQPKAQPKQPAKKTQGPEAPATPPAAKKTQAPEAPAGQPPAQRAPKAAEEPKPAPGQRPAAREEEHKPQRPAQAPAATPPAAQAPSVTPPAAQAPAPEKPGQKQRPASREDQRPNQLGQPPSQPAAQGKPDQKPAPAAQTPPTQTPAAQTKPAQPTPPAAQSQPPQSPAAQTAPTQPPAAQTQPAQPPAAQTRPVPPTPPAAQSQPTQPAAPTAQGNQQAPAGQAQTPSSQPATATAPPPPQQKQMQPAMTDKGSIAPQPTGSQGQPLRRVEDLRNERREVREGDRVVIREPDRVIIQEGGRAIIRHNEMTRFLMGGREIAVDRRGSETTTIVERPDGTRIITVTDEDGRLIRRVRRSADGREVVIIDSRDAWRPGTTYFVDLPPPVVRIPRERYIVEAGRATPEIIYETLMAPPVERIDRRYSLEQIRYSQPLRERMPRVDLDTINFESGSWDIAPDQINRLAVIATAMAQVVQRNPGEVFLVEGHTDAVGADVDNLSLSDRRAEAAALALTERFRIPAENLTTQGYGEQYLKVPTQEAERQNRRVTVRRITPLLTGDAQSTGQAR